LGGGKFANGAMTASFGYLFNQVLSSGGINDKNNPVKKAWIAVFGEGKPVTLADSYTLSGGASFIGGSLTISRDGDIFGAWCLSGGDIHAKYRSPGFDLTQDYIDGGMNLSRDQRADIIGGPQIAVKYCYIGCVGRSYSPTEKGLIGTTSIGFGSPGMGDFRRSRIPTRLVKLPFHYIYMYSH
jgi:hypothetical protein